MTFTVACVRPYWFRAKRSGASRENIVEAYYNLHMWRGIFTAFDLQHIDNPGYNRDRGPVLVPSLRFHLEF